MKSVSGKELAKILEKRDWTLLRVQGEVIIFTAKLEVKFGYQFRFTKIKL